MAANPHSSPAVPDGTPQKRPSLWTRDFALVCLFNLAIFISFQMLMPTIPVYVDRLGGNQAVIGLVTGIFTVSSVALRPWTGLGLDRYGRRGIWLAGTLVFVLAVAGYNWALSIALLMMLRVVHGAGWGILTVSAATAATDLVPPPRRGEGMGFFGLGANLGMAVGLADSLAAFLGAAVVGGLGFGSLHPALQALAVATCAPTRRGAAQATFTASFDLGIGVGAVALGLLAQFTGYGGMFLASAGMALAGLVTYLAVGVDSMPAGKRNVPPS